MGLERTTLRADDHNGFMVEEASVAIQDRSFLDIVESDAEFGYKEPQMTEEPLAEEEPVTTEGLGKQWFFDEEFRLVHLYLKEISKEPLLTSREEIEISAKIAKYRARSREIKTLIAKISKAQMIMGNTNRRGRAQNPSGRVRRLDALMNAYSDKAEQMKQRFIKANLRLVICIARKLKNKGLPLSDLIQEGNIGLMRAVEKFDHTMGYRFSTYASWWIHQSMSRALMLKTKTIKIPLYLLEQSSKVYAVKSKLLDQTGKDPMPEEVALRAGISVEGVKRILRVSGEVVSLDSPAWNGKNAFDGEGKTLLDSIAYEGSPAPDNLMAEAELGDRIKEALSALTDREEEIIRMRFGLNSAETRYTLDEVGRELNLTPERIRQKEKKALRKLAMSNVEKVLRDFLG